MGLKILSRLSWKFSQKTRKRLSSQWNPFSWEYECYILKEFEITIFKITLVEKNDRESSYCAVGRGCSWWRGLLSFYLHTLLSFFWGEEKGIWGDAFTVKEAPAQTQAGVFSKHWKNVYQKNNHKTLQMYLVASSFWFTSETFRVISENKQY